MRDLRMNYSEEVFQNPHQTRLDKLDMAVQHGCPSCPAGLAGQIGHGCSNCLARPGWTKWTWISKWSSGPCHPGNPDSLLSGLNPSGTHPHRAPHPNLNPHQSVLLRRCGQSSRTCTQRSRPRLDPDLSDPDFTDLCHSLQKHVR